MNKEELKQFLQWLEERGIARCYMMEKGAGYWEGKEDVINEYLKELNQNKEQ